MRDARAEGGGAALAAPRRGTDRAGRLLLIAWVCLWLGGFGCSSRDQRVSSHRQRAEQYATQEQWREAKIELLNLLQLDPDDASAHSELADVLWKLHEYGDARWQFREAARLDPNDTEYGMRHANIEFLARDYDRVNEEVDTILERDPENLAALILRGRVAGLEGRVDDQIEALDQVLEIDPGQPAALTFKAQAMAARGDAPGAEAALKQLVSASPSLASHLLLGTFLATQTRDAEALAQYEAAIQIAASAAERTQARLILANFYLNRESLDAAEKQLLDAREESPENTKILLTLAQFYALRGQREAAEQMLEARIEQVPNSAEPLLVLADFHRRMGQRGRALESVNRALAADPRSETARLRKAEYLVVVGGEVDAERLQQAKDLLAEVLEENPNSLAALFTEAKFLIVERRFEEAATRLRRVLEEQPSANAHVLLGSTYLYLADLKLARGEFLQALQMDANNQMARTQLATLYLRTGEPALADQEVRVALRRQPSSPQLLLLHARALTILGRKPEARSALDRIQLDDAMRAGLRLEVAAVYRMGGALERARSVVEGLPGHQEHTGALAELTRIDLLSGQPDAALARLDRAIEAAPEQARLHELRGGFHFRLFAETRDPAALESAERDLQTASEQEPERPEILVALANLYRTAGRADEAVTAYRRAIELRPLYAPVYVALASHYEVMGRLADARENYESALRLNQDLPLAMNNLAWILADAEHPAPEELDRALELAREAKERMPRNPSVADTLGWVMYKRRMSGAAASLFREAIEGYADNGSMRAQVRYHLARTHEAAGQPEQAIEELKRALEDAKEFPGRVQAETLLQRLEAAS